MDKREQNYATGNREPPVSLWRLLFCKNQSRARVKLLTSCFKLVASAESSSLIDTFCDLLQGSGLIFHRMYDNIHLRGYMTSKDTGAL